MTILKILGALVAFGYGLWAGFGRYRQDPDEIERSLGQHGRRRRVRRHLTPGSVVSKLMGIQTREVRQDAFRFGDEDNEDEEDEGGSG